MLLKEKVQLWRERFFGRQEIFGYKKSFFNAKEGKAVSQYIPMYRDKYKTREDRKGKTFTSAAELYLPLGDNHIENHIKGIMELLIYVLHTDHTSNFFALDFDLRHSFEEVLMVKKTLDSHGISCAIARSTSKGHHIYAFFDRGIEAEFITSYVSYVFEEVGFADQQRNEGRTLPETFPKTIELRDETSPGYGIKPPLQGKGMDIDKNCWVDEEDKPIGGAGHSEDQWEFFQNIQINNVAKFKKFLSDQKITISKIRMSEKRGAVCGVRKRTAPYEAPKDGNLNLIITGCPAMKRLWEGPSKDMSHEARVALLSWAVQTQNGLDMLREKWNYSDSAEDQIQYAIETYQQPWTCRALQEHGICIKGKDPAHTSGKVKDIHGADLKDYCFKKVPPRETIHGKVTTNPNNLPEDEWADPSPIRLRVPFKKENVKGLKDQIDDLDKDDPELGGKIAHIYERIVELRDAKQRKAVTDYLKTKKVAKVGELKDFEKEAKEVRKLEKERALDQGDGIQVINGTRYSALDTGGYATIDLDKDGNTIVSEISNFEIELERDIHMHSILNGSIRELHGIIMCQGVKTQFEIPTHEWNNNSKFAGAIAQSAGQSAVFRSINLDRIREAVSQFGTRNLEKENTYEDYGFDDPIKPTVYRSSTFNVTSDGIVMDGEHVDVSRQQFAKHLGISDLSKEDLEKTVKVIKNDLLRLQDPILTFTTIAHSLQSAIHNVYIPFTEAPILWIQGLTGSGKSTLAKFAQSFHGNFPRLLNVAATMRSIEFMAMIFKDALLVIDDFKEEFHRTNVIKLLQTFYDRSGRSRLRKDFSQAQDTHCRGLVMFTAEDRPTSEASALSRCIYIEAPQVIVDSKESDDRFQRILSVEKNFSGVTGKFLHYMLLNYPKPDDVTDRFWDLVKEIKNEIREKQNSHRVSQNLAANYLTWELFLEFLSVKGMLSKTEHSELKEQHWVNILQLRDSIIDVCGQEQASNVFIETLKELIGTGKYVIEGIPGADYDNKNATVIGFMEDPKSGEVFLNPDVCVRYVKDMLRGIGSGLSHSKTAIGKQLLQAGIITKHAPNRNQVRKSYKGIKRWMWCIDSVKSGIGPSVALLDGCEVQQCASKPESVDMSSF